MLGALCTSHLVAPVRPHFRNGNVAWIDNVNKRISLNVRVPPLPVTLYVNNPVSATAIFALANGANNAQIGLDGSNRLLVGNGFASNSTNIFSRDGSGTNNSLFILTNSSAVTKALVGINSSDQFAVTSTIGISFIQSVGTTGSPTALTVTGAAHTTLTASAEASTIILDASATVQFATGALTTQRAIQVKSPTYGFVGASTLATGVTLDISGAPVAGTNATITNQIALRVSAGIAAGVPVQIVGAASQTGNHLEVRNSSGTLLDSINSSGILTVPGVVQTPFALTPGSTVAWNLASGYNATLTPAQNFTLSNPTNIVAGAGGMLTITQDGTGSRVITWSSAFRFSGGTKFVLSTAAGAIDEFSWYSPDGTHIDITGLPAFS